MKPNIVQMPSNDALKAKGYRIKLYRYERNSDIETIIIMPFIPPKEVPSEARQGD
jgi:hypothetical protein